MEGGWTSDTSRRRERSAWCNPGRRGEKGEPMLTPLCLSQVGNDGSGSHQEWEAGALKKNNMVISSILPLFPPLHDHFDSLWSDQTLLFQNNAPSLEVESRKNACAQTSDLHASTLIKDMRGVFFFKIQWRFKWNRRTHNRSFNPFWWDIWKAMWQKMQNHSWTPASCLFWNSQMCQSDVYATSWHLNAEVMVVAGSITQWQC